MELKDVNVVDAYFAMANLIAIMMNHLFTWHAAPSKGTVFAKLI